jgi:hypothetical protein
MDPDENTQASCRKLLIGQQKAPLASRLTWMLSAMATGLGVAAASGCTLLSGEGRDLNGSASWSVPDRAPAGPRDRPGREIWRLGSEPDSSIQERQNAHPSSYAADHFTYRKMQPVRPPSDWIFYYKRCEPTGVRAHISRVDYWCSSP